MPTSGDRGNVARSLSQVSGPKATVASERDGEHSVSSGPDTDCQGYLGYAMGNGDPSPEKE